MIRLLDIKAEAAEQLVFMNETPLNEFTGSQGGIYAPNRQDGRYHVDWILLPACTTDRYIFALQRSKRGLSTPRPSFDGWSTSYFLIAVSF